MIICSVSLAVVFLLIFIYNAKRGQFEDDESPAVRMLFDDEIKEETVDETPDSNTQPTDVKSN